MALQSNVKELIKQGDRLFESRSDFMSLCQELAENFYPERADFTTGKNFGSQFSASLATSYPVLARRDLANTIGAMLRPRDRAWAHTKIRNREPYNETERAYLEYLTDSQRRAMYERGTRFIRTTSEADHDWATFGQAIISVEADLTGTPRLLYRGWHLRDVAWGESHDGQTIPIHRKAKPTAQQLVSEFKKRKGATLHNKVLEAFEKDPQTTFNVRHIVVNSDAYEGEKKWGTPYVQIWVDCDNEHIICEEGTRTRKYVIPRWQTVSGSQYAFSPATIIALPDARLIQSMTWVLLKAGELAIDPPMIGKEGAVRSDLSLFAGGFTWVDSEYDERLGAAIRALDIDRSGVSLGANMREEVKNIITEAFYLNKISLPNVQIAGDMTAFEVGQRVQEYVRQALPLFEPMELEYNGALMEETFNLMMTNAMFGMLSDMPETLAGEDIEFSFSSPISESIERRKGQRLLETKQMLAQVVDVDPSAAKIVNFSTAFRDVLQGIETPAKWINTEDQVNAMKEQEAAMQQQAQILATMQQGADVATKIGEAGQSLREAQVI